jgi:poly(3-hydroxybutyrate) depolymerase
MFPTVKCLALLGVLIAGCSPTTETTTDGACSPSDPASCAYSPAQLYQPGDKVARDIVYTDITGAERTVRVEIRRPMAGPEPSPLILWSHGGSARDTATNVGVDWGEVFNRGGFVVIAIAHEGRDAEGTRALCLALNLGDCRPRSL